MCILITHVKPSKSGVRLQSQHSSVALRPGQVFPAAFGRWLTWAVRVSRNLALRKVSSLLLKAESSWGNSTLKFIFCQITSHFHFASYHQPSGIYRCFLIIVIMLNNTHLSGQLCPLHTSRPNQNITPSLSLNLNSFPIHQLYPTLSWCALASWSRNPELPSQVLHMDLSFLGGTWSTGQISTHCSYLMPDWSKWDKLQPTEEKMLKCLLAHS